MTRERIQALVDKYNAKAQKSYQMYQETGITRYDRESRNSEELADALAMSLNAVDDHNKLVNMRWILAEIATEARNAGIDPVKAVAVCEKAERYGVSQGVIRKEK